MNRTLVDRLRLPNEFGELAPYVLILSIFFSILVIVLFVTRGH
jgi:Na+/melibiose symporter-like transporter